MDGGCDTCLGQTHQAEIRGGEEDCDPRKQIMVASVLQQAIKGESNENCVGQREKDLPERGMLLNLLRFAEGRNDEGDKEQNDEDRGDEHGPGRLICVVPVDVPGYEEGNGSGKGPKQEALPGFETDEDNCGDIDSEDI